MKYRDLAHELKQEALQQMRAQGLQHLSSSLSLRSREIDEQAGIAYTYTRTHAHTHTHTHIHAYTHTQTYTSHCDLKRLMNRLTTHWHRIHMDGDS